MTGEHPCKPARLGEGSFGYVVAAKDLQAGRRVAIKKIKDALEDEVDGKRLLRELKLLRHCRGHDAGAAPLCLARHEPLTLARGDNFQK